MKMLVVWTIIMLTVLPNLCNSQSTNCSTSSANCVSPLTSNFTSDCNAGRLSNYAACLSNVNCLSADTANVQLNGHYCGEGGCAISCQNADPLMCTLMCRRPTDKRQALIQCNNCFRFSFSFGGGAASSTTATIGVLIGAAVIAISTFM